MRINRFFINEENFPDKYLLVNEEIIKQINKVLKLKIGQRIILFNGVNEREYLYEINNINKNNIDLYLIENNLVKPLSNKKVILCQSIIKSGFEDIVRGATEIGVSQILPIISERTEKKSINISRNNKIIQEAIEQSGRVDIFYIENIYDLGEVYNKDNVNYVFHIKDMNDSSIDVSQYTKGEGGRKDIYIWVGPEGGWSDREMDFFKNNGAIFKNLPTYILRAETAGIVCSYEVVRGVR